jgi:replicative DNA helicase
MNAHYTPTEGDDARPFAHVEHTDVDNLTDDLIGEFSPYPPEEPAFFQVLPPEPPKTPDRQKTMKRASILIQEFAQDLADLKNGVRNYVSSGFSKLDTNIPGWLHQGHLVIVAGRPAMGKSLFAQQVAEQVAEAKRTSLFFTLEMGSKEITQRSMARRSGVPISSMKTGLKPDEWSRISEAMPSMDALPFLVDDGVFDIDTLVHKATRAAACLGKEGFPPLGLITVDYLQLVSAKGANRTLEVGQVTMALKRLAKTLSVPVVALSQLSRGVETRQNRRPSLADLRESGNIEQDADLVLFLYRDEYYDPESTDKGIAEVIASKNRHGPTGTTRLSFSGSKMAFGEAP